MSNDEVNASPPSPWHAGERSLQRLHGVAERMAIVGSRMIRDFMPDQHRAFFSSLPFVVVGSVDGGGWPWASLLEGPPGFMRSPDPRRLEIDRGLAVGDPARDGLVEGGAVGLLGIELATRRRNRLNGRVRDPREGGFAVEVEQSFGNCPQYIQRRESLAPTAGVRASPALERSDSLDAEAAALIESADTFFVASHAVHEADPDGGPGRRSVDVSHRGGRPGFVRVDGDRLTIPDFPGNLHFNTLGNLVARPRAGLVFVDFATGDLLQLSGRTELLVDDPEIDLFAGAERLWRLDVESVVRRRGALGLRLRRLDLAKESVATGSWAPLHARRAKESTRSPLPPFTRESAAQKVRLAEDAWNSRDPMRVALAYTEDSRWRNRAEFPVGRAEIEAFLARKWQRELDYRLVKELWAFEGHRIAVRFAYEWHDAAGQWFRSYGNENWEFDANGLMRLRFASINDLAIDEAERRLRWPSGRRPDDHPGLSALGL